MNTILYFHILAGVVGVVSGFAVIGTKKGGDIHRVLGRAFVIGMLCLGLSGAVVAWVRNIPLSLLNGLLIGYFVLTAYQAIRPSGTSRWAAMTGFYLGWVAVFWRVMATAS